MAPINPQRITPPGFETLFKTYYPSLCYFADQYLQNKHQAEDVVQSVFTHWLQEKPHYQSEEHARNLLYKMVKQASLNEMRRLTLHAQPMSQIPKPCNGAKPSFWKPRPSMISTWILHPTVLVMLPLTQTVASNCTPLTNPATNFFLTLL